MKYFCIILFLIFTNSIFAQQTIKSLTYNEQLEIANKAIDLSDSLSDVEPINKLIDSKKITDKYLIFYLLSNKVYYQAHFLGIYKNKAHNIENNFLNNVNKVLETYKSIYDSTECYQKTKIQYQRYSFLSYIVSQYQNELNDSIKNLYLLDLEELKKIGLKPEREGFGLGLYLQTSKELSFGFDFSVYSFFRGVTKFEDTCKVSKGSFYANDKNIFYMNALTFGYTRFIKSNTNDFSLSLLELNSPFVLIPAKFGFQFNNFSDMLRFYYRPGIGLSLGVFSLNFTYNILLSKKNKALNDKYILMLKASYTITNHRLKIKH